MAGWGEQVSRPRTKEDYKVAEQIFFGLGRRMFDSLGRAHPESERDSFIGLIHEVTGDAVHIHDPSGLSDKQAKAKIRYESTEALGISSVTPSDSATFTASISDLITGFIRSAADMQLYNAPRAVNTDAEAQRRRVEFEESYRQFVDEIGKHEALKDMLPVAYAAHDLATRVDISDLGTQLYDPKKHTDAAPFAEHSSIAAFLQSDEMKKEVQYYDTLTEDQLITANANRGRKP